MIANWHRPLDAAAAAPLSGERQVRAAAADRLGRTSCRRSLRGYLLDIQPGYQSDPVRGVYNHAWLIGDESAISVAVQTEIDELTEIVRVQAGTSAA